MMQVKSSNASGAVYLDRAGRIEALRCAAILARKRVPAIRRVILFGSLASGNATPRSDADILVIVENSLHASSRDRIPEMLQALSPLPCPIDLFVLTCDEFDRYRSGGSPLLRAAMNDGIYLTRTSRNQKVGFFENVPFAHIPCGFQSCAKNIVTKIHSI